LNRECPLWVKSGHRRKSGQCPLYPQKQTLELSRVMSALCQKRTYAVQQSSSLFDHLVGEGKHRLRNSLVQRFSGLELDSKLDFRGLLHWAGFSP